MDFEADRKSILTCSIKCAVSGIVPEMTWSVFIVMSSMLRAANTLISADKIWSIWPCPGFFGGVLEENMN